MAVEQPMTRLGHLQAFYGLMNKLIDAQAGPRALASVSSSTVPLRGLYFFFEPGEKRSDSGEGLRIVRVGTHALKSGAVSTLPGRLRQHRGKRDGGGNHRGSIFRLLTGDALMLSGEATACISWGSSGEAARAGNRSQGMKTSEAIIERAVTERLAEMRVACLAIDDEPGPNSQRGWIERNSIALLSNHGGEQLDPPSADWLGHHSSRPLVRSSGLWNQRHVDESYDPAFLDDLEQLIGDHR